MKELTKCPNCGNQNKITAKFCEECGTALNDVTKTSEPNESEITTSGTTSWWNKQSSNSKLGIGIAGICCIGLILLVIVGGMMAPNKTTSTYTSPNTTQQSAATPATENTSNTISQSASEGGIKILSSSPRRDSIGNYIISGEVKNNYNTEVSYVQIVGTGYDANGNVVASHTTYADLDTIQPGGKSPFECYLDDPNHEIVKYELQAQA